MNLYTINPKPHSHNAGLSLFFDFIYTDRSRYYLLGQKYVERHTDKQIEKVFYKCIARVNDLINSFDYDDFVSKSSLKVSLSLYPTSVSNHQNILLNIEDEKKAIIIQKLMSLLSAILQHRCPLKDQLYKNGK